MRIDFLIELSGIRRCSRASRCFRCYLCALALSLQQQLRARALIVAPSSWSMWCKSVGEGRCSSSPLFLSPFALYSPFAPLSCPLAPDSRLLAGWAPHKSIPKCVLGTSLWNANAQPRTLAHHSPFRWLGPSQGNGRSR